jgi:hypothetical protein
MPCPFHSPGFDLPNNIRGGVHVMVLHVIKFSRSLCYVNALGDKISVYCDNHVKHINATIGKIQGFRFLTCLIRIVTYRPVAKH